MKDIFKGVATKVLSIVVILALLGGGAYWAYNHFIGGSLVGHKTQSNVDIVKEKLVAIAELNTGSYVCTATITKSDSKKIKGFKIPLTENSFIIQYDGTVKAGIKDLTKAKVSQRGDTIIVKLPAVEITNCEIDNNSFQILDESNNIFNPINVEDVNDAQQGLKEVIIERAEERKLLELAKENAEVVVKGMLESPTGDYKVKVEWQ